MRRRAAIAMATCLLALGRGQVHAAQAEPPAMPRSIATPGPTPAPFPTPTWTPRSSAPAPLVPVGPAVARSPTPPATASGNEAGAPTPGRLPLERRLPPTAAPPSVPRSPAGGRAVAPPAAPAPPGTAPGSPLGQSLPPPPAVPAARPTRDPAAVEPGEVVVVSASMNEAQDLARQAAGLGFSVLRRRALPGLGFVVTVLRAPAGASVEQAVTRLRQALPDLRVDANHRYLLHGQAAAGAARRYAASLVGWGAGSAGCGAGLRIGLVDTAVDATQPALRGQRLSTRSFLTAGVPAARSDHGTAVAALLVGSPSAAGFDGLLPAAELYAAAVFRQRDRRTVDTTAEWVVLALDWLVGQRVAVVNLSLGGPRNLLLEAAVQRLAERGVAVVAAAGNDGPEGKPVYPAAQSGVLAVTAVDAELRPYARATRGDYVAFAAPGVDLWVVAPGGGGYVSGTSYATPFVTATLAALRGASGEAPWSVLRDRLERSARDLGAPGKDPVFGWGLLQAPVSCARAAGVTR